MNANKNFEINYWGEDYKSIYFKSQSKRTIKKKLLIVSSFVSVLAIVPIIVFSFSAYNSSNQLRISSAVKIKITPAPTQAPPPASEEIIEAIEINKVEVINNDSYWKISKRTCGTGKYYLSLKEQNKSKALYEGDSVKVDCSL